MILYNIEGDVARITLDRPEKRNALSTELIEELREALLFSAKEEAVRAVLIAANGKDFCAGMDLADLARDSDVAGHLEAARTLAEVYLAIRRHPRPVVAAVQGRALGGGCGLATACDLVLAGESAQFGYPEVKLGFIPAIVMVMLQRSISDKRAFELLATGEPILANEARAMGLINRVVPDAEIPSGAETLIRELTSKSGSALGLTKSLLHHTEDLPFESAIEAGINANALARMTGDARRGIEQFVNKKN